MPWEIARHSGCFASHFFQIETQVSQDHDQARIEGKRDASVQRYKGLGEMNAEQLADTTMNPEKRTLLSVRLEDLVATDLIFTTLMGEDV
jgi:DNA gyrase subunit B